MFWVSLSKVFIYKHYHLSLQPPLQSCHTSFTEHAWVLSWNLCICSRLTFSIMSGGLNPTVTLPLLNTMELRKQESLKCLRSTHANPGCLVLSENKTNPYLICLRISHQRVFLCSFLTALSLMDVCSVCMHAERYFLIKHLFWIG